MNANRWPAGLFYLVTLVVLAADQLSKAWALATLRPVGSFALLPGLLNLTFVRNTGIAFGLMAGKGWLVALFVVVLGAVAFSQLRGLDWLRREPNVIGGLLLGGAIGNMVDRWRIGYVVDFIDAHAGTHHWPVFNLADSMICIAVGWIVVRQLSSGNAPAARRP